MVRFTERSLRSVSGGARSLRLVPVQLASLALRIALQVSRERRASGTASRFASLTAGCPAPIRCFIACCFPIVHDRIGGSVCGPSSLTIAIVARRSYPPNAARFAFGKGHDSVPRGIASRKGTQPLPSCNFRQNRLRLKQPFPKGLLLLFLPKAELRI